MNFIPANNAHVQGYVSEYYFFFISVYIGFVHLNISRFWCVCVCVWRGRVTC